jgi:prepilin-type N-terminal cleavage/methylation domain-containing protein
MPPPNERRDATADAGFTLIELMVVLLILAILLAIAIPTFLGVTKSANDRAAQSNLNTALLNAKAQYQKNSQSYPATAALVTALQSAEPSLQFVNGTAGTGTASADQNHISVFTSGDGNALVLTAYSAQTHNCWIVVDTPAVTAAAAPFAAAAAPAQGAISTTANVAFADGTVGPTYGEIKGNSVTPATLQAACLAGQPAVTNGTNYGTSGTAFPAL